MVYGILAVWHGKTDGFLHMIINFAHFTQKEAERESERQRQRYLPHMRMNFRKAES